MEWYYNDRKEIRYEFTNDEKKTMARLLKPEVTRLEKEIQKNWKNPKNEGQVNFLIIEENLVQEKMNVIAMINEFEKERR